MSDTLLFGDNQGNVFIVDATSGVLAATVPLPIGNLVAPPLIRNGVAFLVTDASTVLSLEIATATLGSVQPQLSAAIAGAPVVLTGQLVVATADGYLTAYGVSGSTLKGTPLWTGAFSTSSGNALSVYTTMISPWTLPSCPFGPQLLMFTNRGLYCAVIANESSVTPGWSSAISSSFATTTPVIVDATLYATSGNTLMAWNLEGVPVAGSLAPISNWPVTASGRTLYGPWRISETLLLVGDDAGAFYLLGLDGSVAGTLAGLFVGSSARFAGFWGGVLYQATAGGDIASGKLDLSSGATFQSLWSVSTGAPFVGAPVIANTSQTGGAAIIASIPSTNGRLYRFKENGTQLPVVAIGTTTAANFSGLAPASTVASTAAVRFLLDGPDYFVTLRNLLACVREGSFASPAMPDTPNLTTMITYAAGAGNNVFVIAWQLSDSLSLSIRALNRAGAGIDVDVRSSQTAIHTLAAFPNVATYFEYYNTGLLPGWMPTSSGSNHQKIAIFSINGIKLAVVGGFNLVTPSYFDLPTHPMSDPSNLHTWHDTAFLVQGAVVDLIEAEFDRRWSKPDNEKRNSTPNSSTYAKLAYWNIHHGGCLDNDEVCSSGSPTTPYASPAISSAPVPVSCLITNREGGTQKTEIRAAIVDAINNAQSYAYFENQGFSDGAIVEALSNRLATNPSFRLVVNTPFPESDSTNTYYPMTATALCALQLRLPTWTSFTCLSTIGVTLTIARSDYTFTYVSFNPDDIYQGTFLGFSGISPPKLAIRVPLNSITSITGIDPRVIFCGPARYFATPPASNVKLINGYSNHFRQIYVHSKLALVDDAIAFVGSANFTTRSMLYDGELSLEVNDAATVIAIRNRLFTHWSATDVPSWATSMSTFLASTTNGIGTLPLSVGQLTRVWNWSNYLQTLLEN